MKRLSLLRHAKSSWQDSSLSDPDRPLSARGEQDAPKMGSRLVARKARPSLIMTSPAARALSTARVVADILGYPAEFLQIEPRLYLATPTEMLTLIGSQDDNFSDLLLVGHNPGMTELANRLVPNLRLDNLPTAGVVAMSFQTKKWAELPGTVGALEYYDYPKNPELLLIED